jgi:hypothetical protein
MRADELKFAVRKSGQHLPLGTDDLAQVQHLSLNLEQAV